MQTHGRFALALLFALVATPQALRAQASDDAVDAARREFQAIVSRLDVGGDFLLVGNCEGLVQGLFRGLSAAGDAAPPSDADAHEALATAVRLEAFLRRNGVYAIKGFGISAAPVGDGRHRIKAFVSRDYVESSLPFWRAVVGWHPRRLSSLDFIPGDVAMARASAGDPAACWKLVSAAMADVATPEQAAAFAAWREACDATLGISIERIVESLRDELLVAVRFRADREITLATAAGPVALPAPEILLAVSVKSEMLRGVIEAQLARRGMPVTEVTVDESALRYTAAALPMPLPVQPCLATASGFLLLGSSTNIVVDALAAYRHKTGLVTRPEFIRSLGGLPLVNNGVIYVTPAMTDVAARFRRAHVALWAPPARPLLRQVLQALTNIGEGRAHTGVILNWKSGVMLTANSTWGGKDLLRQWAAHPLRAAGNVTLPALVRGLLLPFTGGAAAGPGPMDDPGAGGL